MKVIGLVFLSLGLFFMDVSIVQAVYTDRDIEISAVKKNTCTDSEFGIQFYCEADWKWRRVNDAILIIVSDNPTVTLTISKVNTPIRFLGQLTYSILEQTGLYADGFKTEHVTIADKNVLQVKAFSRHDENIRLNDYYYVHHQLLYGILFSVNPKEDWEQAKYKIKKIKSSIQFFD